MPSIYSYNQNSESSKALANALGIKRIRHEGGKLKVGTIINWGASNINRDIEAAIINKPEAIAKASNKLLAFKAFKDAGVTTPEFTESLQEANKWLADGSVVVARTKLSAHSGAGIVIVDPDADPKIDIPDAKLYTKYIPKAEEYRLHVFRGNVFFVQRKARNKEVPDDKVNWKVRNHGNGFIYSNQDVKVFSQGKAHREAIKAVEALGLDFGAVDIVYNRNKDTHYVLEVNTAPGLTGSTLEAYARDFKGLKNE